MAASAARSLGRRHEARRSRLFFVGSSLRAEPWSRFVCGPLRGPCRRGRPCGFGPQGLVCGLCALHAGAPVVRAPASSKRRPRPRVARGPWFQSSRPCCGLLRRPQLVRAVFSAAWCVVGLGVSFLKRSLRATPAPAAVSFVVAAVTGLAFLRSRKPRSALPRPAPFVRAGRDKARSNPDWRWLREHGIT